MKRAGLIEVVMVQTLFWTVTLSQTRRHAAAGFIIAVDVFLMLSGVAALVFMARTPVGVPRLAFGLVSSVSLILANFSRFYWSYGGGSNFTRPLTHLDAVYFAVGTLSTAGTGNLAAAVSQTAVARQTAQMAVDIAFTVFAAGVVATRFAAPIRLRRQQGGAPAPPRTEGAGSA
jgi:hypothetical protein